MKSILAQKKVCPLFLFLMLFSSLCLYSRAYAEEIDCLTCHADLASKKNKHAAVDMGCPSCHTAVDASDVPHKMKNKIAKGLSGEQPGLCYGCHEKSKFSRKNVHAALGMGCTSCHNPHSTDKEKLLRSDQPDLCYACHDSSQFAKKTVHAAISMGCTGCHSPHSSGNAKLLLSQPPDLCYGCHDKTVFTKKTVHAAVTMGCTSCHVPHSSDKTKLLLSEIPDLCYSCHDKAEFSRKNVHVPVSGGKCLACHGPHSSDAIVLLRKEPIDVCLDCHASVEQKPHAIRGFNNAGHPLGRKDKKDPKRPDRKFYCGSCHNPHSSDFVKLFRYEAKSTMGLCKNCHKY